MGFPEKPEWEHLVTEGGWGKHPLIEKDQTHSVDFLGSTCCIYSMDQYGPANMAEQMLGSHIDVGVTDPPQVFSLFHSWADGEKAAHLQYPSYIFCWNFSTADWQHRGPPRGLKHELGPVASVSAPHTQCVQEQNQQGRLQTSMKSTFWVFFPQLFQFWVCFCSIFFAFFI